MLTTKVAERGQITIPQAIRKTLGLTPGTILQCSAAGGKLIIEKKIEEDPLDAIYGTLSSGHSTDSIINELRGTDAHRS